MKLDTSPDTAAKMRDAPWNQMVTSFLSVQASERASLRPGYFGIEERMIDWGALFNERIYRIFLEVAKARAGTKDYEYERKKADSRRRRSREYVSAFNSITSNPLLMFPGPEIGTASSDSNSYDRHCQGFEE